MRKNRTIMALTWLLVISLSSVAFSQSPLFVISWNVESGGSDPDVVGMRIAAFDGIDLWGLCEVQAEWATGFETSAEVGENADFKSILGSSGGADRLLIIYNASRLELMESLELNAINPLNRARSPLVARFKLVDSGRELLFMVNHLNRTNKDARHLQSIQLNDWAAAQTIPVIAVGDYNYDWRIVSGESHHDKGYDNIIANHVFTWLRPSLLTRTQHSPSFPPSVLDFVFVNRPDESIQAYSEIVVVNDDFPDDDDTPDHRPLRTTIELGSAQPPSAPDMQTLKGQLVARITALEAELMQLKVIVSQIQ